MKMWQESLPTGNINAMLYVAAVRKDMTATALDEIFGEAHMINHANLHEVNKSRRALSIQTAANRKLSKLLHQQKEKTNSMKKENSRIKISLREARVGMEQLKRANESREIRDARVSEFQVENQQMKQAVEYSERQIEQLSAQKKCVENKNEQLKQEVSDLREVNRKLDDELKQLIAQFSSRTVCEDHCDEECSKLQLCEKKVLIVGGRIRMKHLYRNLVESSGGQFEYHDGYMQNGKQKLEERVKRSDLVICPFNCNSHGACTKVKQLCQKHKKPVKMLPTSSLTAISNVLFESLERKN
jgi:hypothetical protein